MSRLDYAPKLKEIQITDIKKGLGVFTPKPDKAVSFAALKDALKKAGYTLDSAEVVVAGTLRRDDKGWWLVADSTGQRFALAGPEVEKALAGAAPDTRVELTGEWKTVGEGAAAREVITPRTAKKTEGASKADWSKADVAPPPAVSFVAVGFDGSSASPFTGSLTSIPAAPIRVTSPGLTVYKGGAVTPRLFLVEQHLGGLEVSRQVFQLSVSYTPTPRTQLEVEVPVSRTSFDDGDNSGSGVGLGNVTLWGKYRFYRTVKTYGDRQASARFGLELPTGKKDAPAESEVNAPAFVRQQLTPINGGLSPHLDLSFSQAGGRFIFGGNVEGILRSERDGFRMGHEVRVNTDLEYVLLPFKYEQPGGELFVILESSFVHRGRGRVGGVAVPGSNSTEYYLAPGLQYAADPRFVVEGSVQLPVVRNTGPLVLRNDRNILLGIKYLF
ncbi:MAG TPA: hypothetical protein VFS10_06620 [Pyrinomonadaceae bacterium]|nr:hypothetical protein [Pyrinomonadaceae bacterium]